MTGTVTSAARGAVIDDTLRAALGGTRATAWERSRHPYEPTVLDRRAGDVPLAAVLTTRRPSTAATKIVELWTSSDAGSAAGAGPSAADRAAADLLDDVIAASEGRGDAALKWELPAGAPVPEIAVARGFVPLRAPHSSAPGTLGTDGLVRWHRPLAHAEPPYYAQTTLFTCGAVAGLLAVEVSGAAGLGADRESDRDLELAFWRRASNFPAVEPIGLAVVMRESLTDTDAVEVWLDAEGPVLVESYSAFEHDFRAELQAESLRRAAELAVPVHRERVSADEIAARVAAGDLALLLVDEAPMHGETGPHWVLAHAAGDGVVVIQDPWISSDEGETWVDAHELPIATPDLDRMVAWGPTGYRGVVFVSRR